MRSCQKKAKQLSNERARRAFYRKYETKWEAHEKKINFFKPKTAKRPAKRVNTHAHTNYKTNYIRKPIYLYKPKWSTARPQVFSDSSTSSSNVSSNDSSKDDSGRKIGLWAAAAAANSGHQTRLWTAAAEPSPDSRESTIL